MIKTHVKYDLIIYIEYELNLTWKHKFGRYKQFNSNRGIELRLRAIYFRKKKEENHKFDTITDVIIALNYLFIYLFCGRKKSYQNVKKMSENNKKKKKENIISLVR